MKCSFCGKRSTEVLRLIAGPDVYACDECTASMFAYLAETAKIDTTVRALAFLLALTQSPHVLERVRVTAVLAQVELTGEGGESVDKLSEFLRCFAGGLQAEVNSLAKAPQEAGQEMTPMLQELFALMLPSISAVTAEPTTGMFDDGR